MIDYIKKGIPLNDRVVVLPDKLETNTEHIKLADEGAGDDIQTKGEVICVGEGLYENGKRRPMQVQVGDRVLFNRNSGTDVCFDKDGNIQLLQGTRDGITHLKFLFEDSILFIFPR